jgi:predicted O-methyltransferase YrrM
MPDVRGSLASRLTSWAAYLTGESAGAPLDGRAEKQIKRLLADEVFEQQRKRCRLRELPLSAILPGVDRQAIPIGAINVETGHSNHAEMLYVIATARHRQARRIFEFGTFMGRTTYHLAATSPEAHVWTLDLPREQNPWPFAGHVGSYFEQEPERARITRLAQNSTTYDPTLLAHSMDFIWVDADHSYTGVKNDTEKAFALLAPGGAIMWHDFGAESPDLVDFFVEFTAGRPLFRVEKTSVLLHLDGVDPMAFTPSPVPFSKKLFKSAPAAGPTETI